MYGEAQRGRLLDEEDRCHLDEDGDLEPCAEYQRLFMADCDGRKDRACAVLPNGAFVHYDIVEKEEVL